MPRIRKTVITQSVSPYPFEYLKREVSSRDQYNERVRSGGTGRRFDSVSSGDLENLPIAVPPIEEQEQIANTLKLVQDRLRFTEDYTNRLRRLKQGLQQDLLSGTVRTTDTNIEVPDEITQHG
ncbi:restriction endonuclease subunit S [Halorubrum sp. SD626R]